MNVKVKSKGGSPRPMDVFRKWVLIGAVGGALLVALVGAFGLGAVMIGGALAGAAVGVVIGAFRAALTALGLGRD